jgi:hypothetical protein
MSNFHIETIDYKNKDCDESYSDDEYNLPKCEIKICGNRGEGVYLDARYIYDKDIVKTYCKKCFDKDYNLYNKIIKEYYINKK